MTTNIQTTDPRPLKVLRIDSSGRRQGSVTRELADLLVGQLASEAGAIELAVRDLAHGLPFIDEEWIGANFTDPAERSERQRQVLALSDSLVAELMQADVLVIGAPMYNFGIPAALKAWVDMVARARLTFRYGENGPVGLLGGKRAYLVMATGGTAVGSGIDFASGYLRHVLAFMGITEVEIIAAERLMVQGEEARAAAMAEIARLGCIDRRMAA